MPSSSSVFRLLSLYLSTLNRWAIKCTAERRHTITVAWSINQSINCFYSVISSDRLGGARPHMLNVWTLKISFSVYWLPVKARRPERVLSVQMIPFFESRFKLQLSEQAEDLEHSEEDQRQGGRITSWGNRIYSCHLMFTSPPGWTNCLICFPVLRHPYVNYLMNTDELRFRQDCTLW